MLGLCAFPQKLRRLVPMQLEHQVVVLGFLNLSSATLRVTLSVLVPDHL